MMRYNSKKSQGRIKINPEASAKLHALFSQESDASLVSSAAERTAKEKGEATADLSTSSTSVTECDHANTCGGVISLPKIVITPPPANGNEPEKKAAVTTTSSDTGKLSPPPLKLPLLPTSQLRQPERIRSAALRRTPANSNGKKQPQPPLKLPLIKPERVTSASLRRKQPFTKSRPTPIGKEKGEKSTANTSAVSPPATVNNENKISEQQPKAIAQESSPNCSNTEQNQSEAVEAENKGKETESPPSSTADVSGGCSVR